MSLIKTPFGFGSTAADVLSEVELAGKRAIVTGASSGIGTETARALAAAGAAVTLGVRNLEAGAAAADAIRLKHPDADLAVVQIDLSSQPSVRRFISDWDGPLHILVNNAGVMALPVIERTEEGWEMQFATNFLGHFTLTVGLQPALERAEGARIVSVSSSGNLIAPVIFDDPHFDFLAYDPLVAYGQSKTACALLAVEANRRWSSLGIFANALNPGAIATNLQKHTGGLRTPVERQKSVQQGAACSALLAGSPLLEGIGGRYFEDCNEAATVSHRPSDFTGVARYAVDAESADRLWSMALKITQ